jgi:type I restriction enzyme M protein
MIGGASMDSKMNRPRFLDAVRSIAANTGVQTAELALTVATMLAVSRVCLYPEGDEPGFLDQGRELTNADWQAMLRILARRFDAQRVDVRGIADFVLKQPEYAPGVLEHLRRLVFEAKFEAGEGGSPVVPPWLIKATLDFARFHGLSGGLDRALPDLVASIIEAGQGTSVFCAYESSVDFAMWLAQGGTAVTLDMQSPELSLLCTLLAIAGNLPLQVRKGDPLAMARDEMREANEPLHTHDIAIVTPPFNVRNAPNLKDTLGMRLPASPNSESAGVTLALSRARKLAICLLPPAFLFQSSKANQTFREHLIMEHGLDAVVSLPGGMLNDTSIPTALLLLKLPLHAPQTVFMVDARGDRPRPATGMVFPRGLAKAISRHTETEISKSVAVSEVADNNFVLSPERYLSVDAKRIHELTSSSETVIVLEEAVDFFRPQALPKDAVGATENFIEVGAADIDEVGLVRAPTKRVVVAREAMMQARRAQLELGDIILAVKGSAGKVGFIRQIPEGSNWLANQSFLILRLRRHGPIRDPRVVFRYLSSPLGQGKLQSLRGGTAVPVLQMNDMRRLAVAVPSQDEQGDIAQQVNALFVLQDQIEKLRVSVADHQKKIWPESRVNSLSSR